MKYLSTICFSFLFLLMSSSINGQSSMKANQHNPYLTNSEIYKLRKLKIDLFDHSINDKQFQKEVKLTFQKQNEYNKSKAKFAALFSASAIGILTGVAGIIIDSDPPPQPTGIVIVSGAANGGVPRANIKTHYILLGAAGLVTAGFVYKIGKEKNKYKKEYLNQVNKTRGLYDVLIK